MNIAFRAMLYAMDKHKNQVRKYTGEMYFAHLAEVAGIVASVSTDPVHIAVAYLHDVMEDQGVSLFELVDEFGPTVADGVQLLSDLEQGNRATRKELSRQRLAMAPGWVQTIKCADLISNTKSIMKFDPAFARIYLAEKRLLLDVIRNADTLLWSAASGMCADF